MSEGWSCGGRGDRGGKVKGEKKLKRYRSPAKMKKNGVRQIPTWIPKHSTSRPNAQITSKLVKTSGKPKKLINKPLIRVGQTSGVSYFFH